jgi:hypothetical protein
MLMRALRLLNLTVLSVLIGSSALVYAQDEKPQEEKPARQEEAKPQPKQEEAKPSRPEEAKPSKQDNKQMDKQDQKRGQETSREEAKPQGQEHPEMQGDRNRQQGQEHPEMQNEHAQPAQRPEMQNDRGDHNQQAGRGGRIPDDKFRAQFGREHRFNARSIIVQGRPQFQYGGYNFQLVDSWPSDWAYTDDCYIDYSDGQYYLIDLLHPGIRLAVFVVM